MSITVVGSIAYDAVKTPFGVLLGPLDVFVARDVAVVIGGGAHHAAQDAYARELDGAMLTHVAGRFRQRLIDYAPEPEKLRPPSTERA